MAKLLCPIVGGYELSQFVDGQDDLLKECGICLKALKETTMLPCKHLFCKECIGRWIVSGKLSCPYCRQLFNGHSDFVTVTPDPIQELLVYCSFAECKWNGPLKKKNEHHRLEHENNDIECQFCKFNGSLITYKTHLCKEYAGICAVCHNLLNKLCITCEVIHDQQDCNISYLVCNHQYHNHCLLRWMRTRMSCPLCDSSVAFKK